LVNTHTSSQRNQELCCVVEEEKKKRRGKTGRKMKIAGRRVKNGGGGGTGIGDWDTVRLNESQRADDNHGQADLADKAPATAAQ
jgi:hypothetical protein